MQRLYIFKNIQAMHFICLEQMPSPAPPLPGPRPPSYSGSK